MAQIQKINFAVIRLAVIGIIVLIGVTSSFYTVSADSQAVVLRFGKPMPEPVGSGLHFKLPYGIDRALIVEVTRQLQQEYGFGTSGASNPWQVTDPGEQELEKSMVTGDLTILGVSKPVTLTITSMHCGPNPFSKKETCGFDATGSITRSDFGVTYGAPGIGEVLDLHIEFEAVIN